MSHGQGATDPLYSGLVWRTPQPFRLHFLGCKGTELGNEFHIRGTRGIRKGLGSSDGEEDTAGTGRKKHD